MNSLKLAFLLCLLALPCAAQSITTPVLPVTGNFFVSVDDHCTIFINGQKFYHGDLGSSRSPDTVLKVGDRVVVHLVNDVGPRHFMMVFASTDGKQVISFKRSDFKLVPEYAANDFTTTEFESWTMPKELKHKPRLPVKSYSEPIWGNLDRCIVASAIKQEMISQRPQ